MDKNVVSEQLVGILEESGVMVDAIDYHDILDIDSLRYIYIIVRIEEHFCVMFDEDVISDMEISVNSLINLVLQSA